MVDPDVWTSSETHWPKDNLREAEKFAKQTLSKRRGKEKTRAPDTT